MKNITDIFFDLDHTLWDFDKNSVLAFDKIFKQNFPTISTKEFVKIYAPINQACWKLFQRDEISHEELRYQRLKQTFEVLNFAISDEEIDKISNDYINYLPENNQLFDGAINVLEYLYKKYKLHIITNGFAEVQFKKIENSGLSKYFLTITNSEMAGVKKPNPIIYQTALEKANTAKQNAVMIGDCIDADINGALNFGIKAILFNPDKKDVPLNVQSILHLNELKNIF